MSGGSREEPEAVRARVSQGQSVKEPDSSGTEGRGLRVKVTVATGAGRAQEIARVTVVS